MRDSRVRIPSDVLKSMLDALVSIQGQNALIDSPGYIARCELDIKVRVAIWEFRKDCPRLAKRLAKELYG